MITIKICMDVCMYICVYLRSQRGAMKHMPRTTLRAPIGC